MNPSLSPDAVVAVALPVPLYRVFDYTAADARVVPVGCRVRVPFGRGHRIGFVVPRSADNGDGRELKRIAEVIDSEPLFDDALLDLLCWASDYYQHPLGEVLQAAVPTRIRRGQAPPPGERRYHLAAPLEAVLDTLPARAVRQRNLATHLAGLGTSGADRGTLKAAGVDAGDALKRLEARGLVECTRPRDGTTPTPGPRLNARQREAVDAVIAAGGGFACFLLMGVTGSGKTEVYLQCARHVIERGRQVLVLVPEIALTPQLIDRFRSRLGRSVAVMHSALADGERQRAWLQAASGEADVVLGTRLAVFSRLARPGLVIVDEEHDTSFKQQEGFRYHARDVAIKRAAVDGVPVVLGSATPSLESYHNAVSGRYRLLALPERAGAATLPDIRLVDATRWPLTDGLSQPLVRAIDERLARGEQSLVFINRRGFAPVVICGGCGWQAHCTRCDSFLTLHRRENLLRCHHCGLTRTAPAVCPACGGGDIYFAGAGTQRIEQALTERFPAARIARIDRDTSTARGSLEAHLDRVRRREVDILVGTQLMSKGHDFPGITLVGVVNGDQGMYSIDFRATERLFQAVTQVAGRAGRGARRGLVLLQTRFTGHPCLDAIVRHDFESFARAELATRRQLGLPPLGYLALLRAESVHTEAAMEFLARVRDAAGHCADARGSVEIMDPVPAPMERRAGRARAQLMFQSRHRAPLRALLHILVRRVEDEGMARRVRWSVDVDPVDLY